MKRMGILAVACAAAVAVGCSDNTRTDSRNDPAAVGTAGEADRMAVHDSEKTFVEHQLADGMAEVELGRMVADRAANADVKRFGQMMVQDHSKAGDELKAIAARYNVPVPATVDDTHQDLMSRLSTLRGAEFDREYMKAMVDDHEDAIDSLEKRVDSHTTLKDQVTGKDTATTTPVPEPSDNAPTGAVNEWAARTLPTIRHHHDEAKRITDRLQGADRNTTARK